MLPFGSPGRLIVFLFILSVFILIIISGIFCFLIFIHHFHYSGFKNLFQRMIFKDFQIFVIKIIVKPYIDNVLMQFIH